ncbi:MAG TPA: hypothetical protein VL551_18390 [Actinospica sp.]|nr:hypothetical protein [Actinospica sp.]
MDVPLASLKLGDRLGRGGQADVFRIVNRPGEVLKQYFSPNVNGAALDALVAFPRTLDALEREALFRQSAWPIARVTKQGRTVGCLMKEIPGTFIGRTQAGARPRELQYLLFQHRPTWGDITPLDTHGRIDIAQSFAGLMRVLHDHGIVVGDISMNNLLWSPGIPPQIYLIDCDSPTPTGMAPVLAPVTTPDWMDPQQASAAADFDSDRYKLALTIGRTLCSNAYVTPGQPLDLPPDLPEPIAAAVAACFADAAGPRGTRPHAARWAHALRGRGEVRFGPPPAGRPSPAQLPLGPLDGRGPRGSRPVIPFNPPWKAPP